MTKGTKTDRMGQKVHMTIEMDINDKRVPNFKFKLREKRDKL